MTLIEKRINITRKDKFPVETIRNIRKELQSFNIRTRIVNVSKTKSIYSIRLEIRDMPGVGVNGKGISFMYALASAYSEFMERFQSGFLLKSVYLNKEQKKYSFRDEVSCDINILYNNYRNLIENSIFPKVVNKGLIWKELNKKDDLRKISYFTNLITDNKVQLPISLINFVTHTNGLCSGNSRNEALVQGICEVFERYCYRTIITNNIPTKIIDIGDKLEGTLGWIKKRGYKYEVRDFSLGIFPVVALIIYNDDECYQISVGSDPVLDIAIQRCITELFQGLSFRKLKNKLKRKNSKYEELEKQYGDTFVNANWMKCYTTNNGMVSNAFFKSVEQVDNIEQLPFINNMNNGECLEYLLSICRNRHYPVFIKEYTRKSFKTYRVYIPGMSEVDIMSDDELTALFLADELKDSYYNPLKISETIHKYNELDKNIRFSILQKPHNFFKVDNSGLSYYFCLDFKELFVLSVLISEDDIELFKCIQGDGGENSALYSYGKMNKKQRKCELQKTIKLLKPPSCPDCKECLIKKKCKYKEWKKLQEKIYA